VNITILTLGSRGDVQPYLALGLGLQRAGHAVTLAASPGFEPWIRSLGLGYAPVRFNPEEFLHRREVQQSFQNWNRHPRRFLDLVRQVQPLYAAIFDDFWQACQTAEAVVVSVVAYGGYDCAEKLGLRSCLTLTAPLGPTTEFSSFVFPPGPRLGIYNWLTHILIETVAFTGIRAVQNRWRRRTLGLPPLPWGASHFARMRAAQVPWLYAYSPAVVPKPHDWPAWCQVTGYWFLDSPADYQPPEPLAKFLEAGPPPVYIGFGSASAETVDTLTKNVLCALQMTGQRGLLVSGWAGLGQARLPETVLRVDAAPHDWLFPRMAAAVHHGGAGTLGASLRAGLPTIVTPFNFDQFGWGAQVARLGVGPKALPFRNLTAEKLAAAIHTATTDQAMRARAAALGRQIRAEDGVGRAVEVITRARSRNEGGIG
jgi:sterol 3beta-glucosyltransferase